MPPKVKLLLESCPRPSNVLSHLGSGCTWLCLRAERRGGDPTRYDDELLSGEPTGEPRGEAMWEEVELNKTPRSCEFVLLRSTRGLMGFGAEDDMVFVKWMGGEQEQEQSGEADVSKVGNPRWKSCTVESKSGRGR